jgi:ABC-type sugar transport system ATPase subunit
MARIALEHVDKTYPNGYTAARDLSLEANDGELLVLVGPSGGGNRPCSAIGRPRA